MSSYGFAGDLLIRTGVVDASGLERGLEAQSRQMTSLGRALAGLGLATESSVAAPLAAALHLEYLDGAIPDLDAAATAQLPAEFCRKRHVAPLGTDGRRLRVAVMDPLDHVLVQDVEFRTGKQVTAVLVTQTWLETLLARAYPEPEGDAAVSYDMLASVKPEGEVEAGGGEYDLVDSASLARDLQLPPIVKLVNLILSDAAKAGASDIHIEPHEKELRVRQRVDGLLHEVLTIPHHLQDATLSRLKIMSGMDIAERRKPQDGRCRLRFEGQRIDLRVSTMPTQFGEKIVIRLLRTDKAVGTIDTLGLSPRNLDLLRGFIARPQGMLLVTGPTGSGKTSTLYAAVNSVKSSSNNIITLEDPIEIQLAGINQMQVNVRAGVTFASGLRSLLRQDPNVILVGEIRDAETAEIALGAAQTGHLLLSTLHTNDAPATISRLYDLGIPPFMVAASVVGIVAQRLVRRVCAACAVEQGPAADVIEQAGGPARLPATARWMAGRGCDSCGQSGFKGRLAIHEVLMVTDEIRDLIGSRAAEHVIRKAARRSGMRTLLEDGIDKAAQGLTTLEEVVRVAPQADLDDETLDKPCVTAPAPPAAAAGVVPEAATTEPASAPARILVVEDSPTVVTVVKYFLELEGFEVLVAEDGRIGLETALRARPDVIVTDVNMPGMGGVEMVRALRADARTAHLSILMLTTEAGIESETAALAAGADDYMVKPVEPRRLAARVKALRARSRVAAEATS